MALGDLTDASAVEQALREFDQLGRDAFLAKHRFARARSYFLVKDGRAYDSKAIAGVAHGYQHPHLGALTAADFSGGNDTVRAKLEALGFVVKVTEPRPDNVRPLALFEDYSRRDVRDIFSPESDFTPGAGLWGLSGIVEHQPGEFVVFVTFGKTQGDHTFDEGITTEGVLTWQSQPDQALQNPQVRRLIAHDSDRGNVRLFLRTGARSGGGTRLYTYLGRLSYLTHDAERERPVHFQWQVIDSWPPPATVLSGMGLTLSAAPDAVEAGSSAGQATTEKLVETLPPSVARRGRRTADFKARKVADRSVIDAKNRELGLAGELAVVAHERQRLVDAGKPELAALVRHVSFVEGDGAGYDVKSFDVDGTDKFIEVKTTRGGVETDFLISANEVAFSERHPQNFVLYRLYDFDTALVAGKLYVLRGSLVDDAGIELTAVNYRVRVGRSQDAVG